MLKDEKVPKMDNRSSKDEEKIDKILYKKFTKKDGWKKMDKRWTKGKN